MTSQRSYPRFRLRGRARPRAEIRLKPIPRGLLVRKVEVLHLRMDEMACDWRHDCRETAVRGDRNFLDSLMMMLDELQVGEQRAEILPAGKRFCVYQYSAQRPMLLQTSIYVARQRREVCRFKRPSGFLTSIPSSLRKSWLSIGYPPSCHLRLDQSLAGYL